MSRYKGLLVDRRILVNLSIIIDIDAMPGMCTKYIVTSRNKEKTIQWETHFCGQGVRWGGDTVSSSRCFDENNVEGE